MSLDIPGVDTTGTSWVLDTEPCDTDRLPASVRLERRNIYLEAEVKRLNAVIDQAISDCDCQVPHDVMVLPLAAAREAF